MTELKQFLSGYFHQDWIEEASGPDEVITQFLSGRPGADVIERIVDQIHAYINGRDDSEIELGLLKDLGCYYRPAADGMSARDWLRILAERLSR